LAIYDVRTQTSRRRLH